MQEYQDGCGGGRGSVEQVSLDVELWLDSVLSSVLLSCGFTLHSLTDYDLQLVEV